MAKRSIAVVEELVAQPGDYQRLLLLQALGVGFAIAMVASLTVGFLGIAGLPMGGAGWVVYSAGMLGWLVASRLVQKR